MGKARRCTKRADDTIRFIESFLKMPGNVPIRLFPWQKDFLRDILAEGPDGRRIVREVYLSMARKNLKTTTISLLACALLAGPLYEPGMRIVCAATTKDQAKLLHKMTADFLRSSPQIAKDFKFTEASIYSDLMGCNMICVGSRESSAMGEAANVILFDELAQASSLALWNTLVESSSNVPNRFAVALSTMSQKPQNPMTQLLAMRDQAEDDGRPHEHIYAKIHQGNPDESPYTEEQILAANPSMPYIDSLREKILEDMEKAKINDEQKSRFLTYRLNVCTGGADALVDSRVWAGLVHPQGLDRLKELEGCHARLSVDLSRSRDLTSIGIYIPEDNYLHTYAFLPTDEIERAAIETRAPFREWAAEGWIEGIAGDLVDYNLIADRIGELSRRYKITTMEFDAWQADALMNCLHQRSINIHMEAVRQGYASFTPRIIAFQNLIEQGDLRHSGSPVLRFCLNNCFVNRPENAFADAMRPVKAYTTSKIDCAIAALMAVGVPAADNRSVMGLSDLIWGGAEELKRKGMAAA